MADVARALLCVWCVVVVTLVWPWALLLWLLTGLTVVCTGLWLWTRREAQRTREAMRR